MKIFISAVFFALLLASADLAIGTAYQNNGTPPAPALIYSPKRADILIFRGTITQLDEGTALVTDRAVYPLLGGDFAMIIGNEVNIIGKMVKEGEVKKILVARIQFDRE